MTTSTELTKAIDRYTTARPAMRQPMKESATVLALKLADERDALVARMEKRWAWCDAHEEHAQFVDREDALIQDIADYEQMEDALRVAAGVLLGDAA